MSTATTTALAGDDLDALAQIRRDVAADLTAAGFVGATYRGGNLTIGAAVVIPGRPYVSWRGTREEPLAFGEARVGFDVLLLGRPEATAAAGEDMDARISAAVQALDTRAATLGGFGVSEVSAPGLHKTGSASFLAAVVTTTEHHRF